MLRKPRMGWGGLYLLGVLAGLLLYGIAKAPVGTVWHTLALIVLIVAACGLALRWSEGHADLMGSQGVDAQAEEQALQMNGIEPGRLAPSLTARQARYRQVMLAHDHTSYDSRP